MRLQRDSDQLTVCILAGGLGKRLGAITQQVPKPMVHVSGRPFLHLLMDHFASLGFRRYVLAVGYLWEQIRDYFSDGRRFGWDVQYAVEPEPLGTGGAVLWARELWGDRALVANGDTFLPEDWRGLLAAHDRAGLPATMALVHCDDCSRYGKVATAGDRVTAFEEKRPNAGPGWVNGGVYVLEAQALEGFRRGQAFSLEADVFPRLAGRIAACPCRLGHVDIGTPESLAAFRRRSPAGRTSE